MRAGSTCMVESAKDITLVVEEAPAAEARVSPRVTWEPSTELLAGFPEDQGPVLVSCLPIMYDPRSPKWSEHYRLGSVLGRGQFGDVRAARLRWKSHMYTKQRRTTLNMPRLADSDPTDLAPRRSTVHDATPSECRAYLDKDHYVQSMFDYPFACKIMSTTRADLSAMRQEIAMLQLCQHPRTLLLVEHFEARGHLYMVTGRCYGDVLTVHNSKRKVPTAMAVKWVQQLLEGLAHVHSFGIVHRDVKMANMFLSSTDDVVLGDFGFAEYEKTLADSYSSDTRGDLRGTPLMLSPEVFLGSPQTSGSDVWAAGVVMYELLASAHPFSEFQRARPNIATETERTFQRLARCFSSNPGFGQRFVVLAAMVTSSKHRIDYRRSCFTDVPELSVVIDMMLTQRPSARQSCETVLSMPLFTEWAPRQEEAEAPSGSWGVLSGLRKVSSYFTPRSLLSSG